MTLFLSEDTRAIDIQEGVESGILKAIKFYQILYIQVKRVLKLMILTLNLRLEKKVEVK